ncbi:MAG: hypothetical protein H0U87_10775 [Acidobacteria bacterium]|jgi:hypothetical protein|nr:hypothetical protein [Acidobacteriota bacterium]
MGLFSIFKPNKKENSESARLEFLRQNGRITDGTIIDSETNEAGEEIVFFIYSVHGVDFESSEILSRQQRENPLAYAPGAKVGIRFDPKNHGNSILM